MIKGKGWQKIEVVRTSTGVRIVTAERSTYGKSLHIFSECIGPLATELAKIAAEDAAAPPPEPPLAGRE